MAFFLYTLFKELACGEGQSQSNIPFSCNGRRDLSLLFFHLFLVVLIFDSCLFSPFCKTFCQPFKLAWKIFFFILIHGFIFLRYGSRCSKSDSFLLLRLSFFSYLHLHLVGPEIFNEVGEVHLLMIVELL